MLLRGNDDDAVMVFGARFGGGCCGFCNKLCAFVRLRLCRRMESDDADGKRRTNLILRVCGLLCGPDVARWSPSVHVQ